MSLFREHINAGRLVTVPEDYPEDLIKRVAQLTGVAIPSIALAEVAGSGLARLIERAWAIHARLPWFAKIHRTTAVLSTKTGTTIVAGGIRDLIPAQKTMLQSGEVAAKLPRAHAEVTALEHAAKLGLSPQAIAVTWVICPECATVIERLGGRLTSSTTAIFP